MNTCPCNASEATRGFQSNSVGKHAANVPAHEVDGLDFVEMVEEQYNFCRHVEFGDSRGRLGGDAGAAISGGLDAIYGFT